MVLLNTLEIDPPLINTSCIWSSDLAQLTDLYESAYTGAITTRTATLHGFKEDSGHAVAFDVGALTTINSFGYSPHPLSDYLNWVEHILTSHKSITKPVIVSIAASGSLELAGMIQSIQELRNKLLDSQFKFTKIGIELNTSCPNIQNMPPSGYTLKSLSPLLQVLANAHREDPTLTIGLKLPPYVYKDQFVEVVNVLQSFTVITGSEKECSFAFLTCTNTLGNSLLFSDQTEIDGDLDFAVPTVLGGLAGQALHPLALGNVYTFKKLIQEENSRYVGLGNIKIIGVGGVTSRAAAKRMEKAGADVIGCATLFGKEGVYAFEVLGKD